MASITDMAAISGATLGALDAVAITAIYFYFSNQLQNAQIKTQENETQILQILDLIKSNTGIQSSIQIKTELDTLKHRISECEEVIQNQNKMINNLVLQNRQIIQILSQFKDRNKTPEPELPTPKPQSKPTPTSEPVIVDVRTMDDDIDDFLNN